MRLKTIYSAMILAAVLVLASCNAVDTAVNTNNNSNTVVSPPTTIPTQKILQNIYSGTNFANKKN